MSFNMPDDQKIALIPMPQQEGVRTEDDWTGTIGRVERRKLQNRLNQRSYRKPLLTVNNNVDPDIIRYTKKAPAQCREPSPDTQQ